jgi:hypothetical protein
VRRRREEVLKVFTYVERRRHVLVPIFRFYLLYFCSWVNILSCVRAVADFWGEVFADFFGVTSSKYQYVIDAKAKYERLVNPPPLFPFALISVSILLKYIHFCH